jgi:hypothetical protein
LFESTREQSPGPHLHLSDPASLRYYPSALLSNPQVLNSYTLFPALSPAPYESFDPHHSTSTSPSAQPTVAFECEAIVISPRFDNGLRIVWATQASNQLNLSHEQKAVRFSFPSHTLINLAARTLDRYSGRHKYKLKKSDDGRQIRGLRFYTTIAVIRGGFFETFPGPGQLLGNT